MKRMNFILFIFLWVSICYGKSSSMGQETWGGDATALKFVKTARILADEMSANPLCDIKSLISKSEFDKVIGSTEVESAEADRADSKGHIYFNRLKWFDLPKAMKIESVLKKYLNQKKIASTDQKIAEVASHCTDSPFWVRNRFQAIAFKNTNLNLKTDVLDQSKQLLKLLKTKKIRARPPQLDIKKMENLISDFEISSADPSSEDYVITASPITITFRGGVVKDGTNTLSSRKIELRINKSIWGILTQGQKKEFLFHEFLGLLRIHDQRYQYSSLLFLDLSDEEYKN